MSVYVRTLIPTRRNFVHVVIAALVVISGLSTASPASARGWPPLAPSSLTLTPGDGQLTADWTESSTNGNSPIDHYTLYVYPEADEDSATIVDVPVPTLTYTATGLTNGTSFCVAIETTNIIGYRSTSLTRSCATPVASAPSPSPTPTPSDTASPSATPSDTATPTPSATASPSPTASPSETASPSPTASPSETASATPSPSASSLTAQGITYYVDGDGNAVVTGCDGACPSSLSIPFLVNQRTLVTSIASYAFANQTLSAVTIPWSVVAIGDHAFEGNALTTLTIQGAPGIGSAAFKDNNLTSVTMGSNAPVDGGDVFANNSDLTAIDVTHGTSGWSATWGGIPVRVGPAFTYTLDGDGNATLTGAIGTPDSPFVVPDSIDGHQVTGISNWAFSGLPLTSVTLPNTLKSIGSAAFRYSSVSALTIPSSVTYIGSSAFANTALTSIVFEGDAPSIGSGPLFESSPLTAVDAPYGATGWNESFSGVTVRVPVQFNYTIDSDNNVTITGCLNSCPSDVVIPSSIEGHPVTAIGDTAFQGKGLTTVTFPDRLVSIGNWAFENNSLTSVTLPASLTTLSAGAFYMNSLTSVTIPSSVTTIYDFTFQMNSLTSVTFEGNAPSAGYDVLANNPVFANNPGLTGITVAYGTTGWASTFSNVPVNVVGGPVGKPASAPKIRTAKLGNGKVTLGIWTPSSNGGTEITGYEYTVDDGATWTAVDASSTATSLVITGLNNGNRYTVKVRAVNGAFGGAASNARAVTPRTVASAPTITALTDRNGAIKVEFEAPASNGGSTITRYAYSVNGNKWINWGPSTSPQIIKALHNGVVCSIRVRALNAAGWGTASEAVEATPHR